IIVTRQLDCFVASLLATSRRVALLFLHRSFDFGRRAMIAVCFQRLDRQSQRASLHKAKS
ncbi:hypothetical protein ABTM38_19485, partial [Acinetobacter baumannii]